MSPKNNAISTCFSNECASILGSRPIRLCQACHDVSLLFYAMKIVLIELLKVKT